MDREAALKKIKMYKTKAKAAKKAGKKGNALGFKYAMQRVQRELKAAEPKIRRKKSVMKEATPGPTMPTATPAATPAAAG